MHDNGTCYSQATRLAIHLLCLLPQGQSKHGTMHTAVHGNGTCSQATQLAIHLHLLFCRDKVSMAPCIQQCMAMVPVVCRPQDQPFTSSTSSSRSSKRTRAADILNIYESVSSFMENVFTLCLFLADSKEEERVH